MKEKTNVTEALAVFNQLYKEVDEIYQQYAKNHGISDTALWLLYSLYENSGTYTQRDVCADWHYPPQTINSALKSLEKQGVIVLEAVSGNQKNKRIFLTDKGQEISRTVIAPLVLAEQRTFRRLQEEERELLLSLTGKYVELLQKEMNEDGTSLR